MDTHVTPLLLYHAKQESIGVVHVLTNLCSFLSSSYNFLTFWCDLLYFAEFQVMMGQGIDRHLLGLKLTAIEHGMNVPDLLMDPVYTTTNYWKLSTSQVRVASSPKEKIKVIIKITLIIRLLLLLNFLQMDCIKFTIQ